MFVAPLNILKVYIKIVKQHAPKQKLFGKMRAPGFLLFNNKKMKLRLTHQDAIRRGPGTLWNRGGMNVHCVSPVHFRDRKERGIDSEKRD